MGKFARGGLPGGRPRLGKNGFSGLEFRPTTPAVRPASTDGAGDSAERQARQFGRRLLELSATVAGLRRAGAVRARTRGSVPARAASQLELGLSVDATATTLRSRERLNTQETSFGPRAPRFTGGSDAAPVIAGEYDGLGGDTTLTFTATEGGTVGVTPITLGVVDARGRPVATVHQGGLDPAGKAHDLGNGLTVALRSGSVSEGDRFTVKVSATVGSVVDPSAAFDGEHDDGPHFDPGQGVVAGAFELNGTSLPVKANDSILDVLDRINASAAGVQATFEIGAEQLVLTQETPGPGETIHVAQDTSGFLAAAKLAGAAPVPGTEDQRGVPLSRVAACADVQSGTFAVNGYGFTVDVERDSLRDLIERINGAALGVTASYSAETDRFALEGEGSGAVTTSDGSSGFFTALHVAEGTRRARPGESISGFATPAELLSALRSFVRAYRALQETPGDEASVVDRGRAGLDEALVRVFARHASDSSPARTPRRLGLELVATERRRVLELNEAHLAVGLGRGAEDFRRLLFSVSGPGGLVGAVESEISLALAGLEGFLSARATGREGPPGR